MATTCRLGLPVDRLFRHSYSVDVRVMEAGREVDGLRASSPESLRESLRPVYRHLDAGRQSVLFSGVEERWLPGGLMRSRREVKLHSLNAALAFLEG